MHVKKKRTLIGAVRDLKIARGTWPDLTQLQLDRLQELLQRNKFSLTAGDLVLIEGKWYITHSGLLRLANRKRCRGIQVQPVAEFCHSESGRWAFKATVFKSATCKGFVGFGDADPTNVSSVVHGAEMRIAETRAVNRALRKAYGIGICSVEELGTSAGPAAGSSGKRPPQLSNGHCASGHARVRDRLCQLIRQHRLDPALVKSYAIDFCRVASLKEAKREQVETFVEHLSEWAAKDRDALLCRLNSYQPAKQEAA